ncbi:Gfo/Idh/MocA family protein [Glaciibacter psychrotolerans]|uniref:Myo-inositol 2-dehydrogenase/D-chiro-inositol 1-dehydrogenase n=1 Tax=Glaciibacter psychrotolerans TaxID=670054 RepID=A0A7Z0EFB0_9MICO|nr:Gfo/Idh/MocA family oxidoreductase [Leifsonia psychrotolerans]NYJ20546.1 myo-inositol 2-dehydrogenase/D-chiro-inositol 1-dehydrogenase [Leifsonia psychrotolerans]
MNFPDLRVGIVGSGGMGQTHAAAWRELGVQLFAYSPRGAQNLVDDFGATACDSVEALLASCDVLDVCSPTPTHPELITAGIDAGVAIICEKPLALTALEAEQISARASAAGVPLYPAHVVRFFPEYLQAKQSVDAGAIGQVSLARFSRVGEFPSWAPWFADEQRSGGVVLDLMIHDFDAATWISGPVTRVYAVRSPAIVGSSVTSAQVILTHASGAISSVTGIWGAPGTPFSTTFSLVGTTGAIQHDSRHEAQPGSSSESPSGSVASEDPYLTQLREFVQGIRGELVPRVSAADGVIAVRIARAALESIASGQPVELAEADQAHPVA